MAVTQSLQVYEIAGSVDTAANTSKVRILWQSTQSGDSWNGYSRTAKYWVHINQGGGTEYTVAYTLPKNTTKIIVDREITVTHRADGTGIVQVYTEMDTGISAGVIEKYTECKLSTIPRASTISTSTVNEFDNYCYLEWTPLSKDFRYKLNFKLNNYDYTTGAIHPNRLSVYGYDDYIIPLSLANNVPADKDRVGMTVTLYTYSDSGCSNLIGSSTDTLVVRMNNDDRYQPTFNMSLSPADSPIASAYLQGRSKVKATFSGAGKYGATIVSYSLKVNGKTYTDPYISDILPTSGDITVFGYCTDSRGFTSFTYQTINVSAYDKPSVIPYTGKNNIVCKRCLSDGTLDGGGTYLLVEIGRRYSKVVSGGSQKNFCKLSYSYKTDAQDVSNYSEPTSLIPEAATGDYVSVILPNVVGSITTAYNVRLIAEDTAGESDIITITIPTAFVTFHAPKGGHGFTLGGYHDSAKKDVFDCKFDAEFEGVVRGNVLGLLGSSGNIPTNGDLNDYKTPGVYAIPSAGEIKNMPIPYPGLIRVYTSTGQTNLIDGKWLNLMQEYQCYEASVPTFRRRLYNDDQYNWSYGEWTSDASASITTEADTEVLVIGTRKGSDIYELKLTPSGISYSKNRKVLWTK